MFRRRRAFSRRGASRTPQINPVLAAGVAAVGLIGTFIYLVHLADSNPPARAETRIELPDAFASR